MILCAAAEPVLARDEIEIVRFQSLTFPGNVFTSFMPAPEEGRPASVFGILRMPVSEDRVPAVVLTHGCAGITGAGGSFPSRPSALCCVIATWPFRIDETCQG